MEVLLGALATNDTAQFSAELRKGFDVDRLNRFDGQADAGVLHLAAFGGNLAIVRMLLDAGVKPDLKTKEGGTPIELAAAAGQTEVVELLLTRGPKDHPSADSALGSAMLAAARAGHLPTVRALIAGGAPVNVGRGIANTPLSAAALEGHGEVVAVLLRAGAQADGFTAFALKQSHPEIRRMILEADPRLDFEGRASAIQSAGDRLDRELAAFLRDANRTGSLDQEKLAAFRQRAERLKHEAETALGTHH